MAEVSFTAVTAGEIKSLIKADNLDKLLQFLFGFFAEMFSLSADNL